MGRKKWSSIYFITVIVAFCSITYELLLAQSLSAFLGDTVLRYSVTIGLYMASMGIGAILVTGKMEKKPLSSLLLVELFLVIIGSLSVISFHLLDFLRVGYFLMVLFTHLLIIIIGVLTGTEIPLLINLRSKEKPDTANMVLGFDYLGALLGTLFFAFIFYPKVGIFSTAFIVALLNALAGMFICFKKNLRGDDEVKLSFYLGSNIVLAVVLIFFLIDENSLEEFFVKLYLGG